MQSQFHSHKEKGAMISVQEQPNAVGQMHYPVYNPEKHDVLNEINLTKRSYLKEIDSMRIVVYAPGVTLGWYPR